MYDATLRARERAGVRSNVLSRHGLKLGDYVLATVHRAGNTDDSALLRRVLDYVKAEAGRRPVALPLHPRTRTAAEHHGIDLSAYTVLPPIGYFDMAALLADCTTVFTDSGGVQKEACFHGKPCVTLRDETEWLETVEQAGTGFGRSPTTVLAAPSMTTATARPASISSS